MDMLIGEGGHNPGMGLMQSRKLTNALSAYIKVHVENKDPTLVIVNVPST